MYEGFIYIRMKRRFFLAWVLISTWQVIRQQIRISPWIHYPLPFAYSFWRVFREGVLQNGAAGGAAAPPDPLAFGAEAGVAQRTKERTLQTHCFLYRLLEKGHVDSTHHISPHAPQNPGAAMPDLSTLQALLGEGVTMPPCHSPHALPLSAHRSAPRTLASCAAGGRCTDRGLPLPVLLCQCRPLRASPGRSPPQAFLRAAPAPPPPDASRRRFAGGRHAVPVSRGTQLGAGGESPGVTAPSRALVSAKKSHY